MIVFNDLARADGFEIAIDEANKILSDFNIQLQYNFIKNYNSEFAYSLTVERHEEFGDDKQLHLL
jgi:hypothetical protein